MTVRLSPTMTTMTKMKTQPFSHTGHGIVARRVASLIWVRRCGGIFETQGNGPLKAQAEITSIIPRLRIPPPALSQCRGAPTTSALTARYHRVAP